MGMVVIAVVVVPMLQKASDGQGGRGQPDQLQQAGGRSGL
jgi:hypothetical protein